MKMPPATTPSFIVTQTEAVIGWNFMCLQTASLTEFKKDNHFGTRRLQSGSGMIAGATISLDGPRPPPDLRR